jgi:NADP-dependent 3-hydroxy acid dehydrogenase YdfG
MPTWLRSPASVRLEAEDKAKAVYAGVEPLKAEDVAECIRWSLVLPDHVNIDQLIVKCRDQASHNGTRIHRRA